MGEFSEQIALIKQKVSTLLSDNQSLKNDLAESKKTIEGLKLEKSSAVTKLTEIETQLSALKSENENLKLATPSSPTVTKPAVSEKEISKMIKEIDECLALLDI